LACNKVSDEGLKNFFERGHNFPKLQIIDLEQNQISEKGLTIVLKNKLNFINLQKAYIRSDNTGQKVPINLCD
jgi:hypothetical protein